MKMLGFMFTIIGIVCLVAYLATERAAGAGFFHVDLTRPLTIFTNPGFGLFMLLAGIAIMALSPARVTRRR
jgi:hypothetical protein